MGRCGAPQLLLAAIPTSRLCRSAMNRTVVLSLLCLSVALVVLPATHLKPGMPATLKADEPAYYLAALSLVKDGDLRCEPKDLARGYAEYPYLPIHNLILSTDDGWRTVYFGKPYIFSLLAAPLAAIWGANGLVVFNALLLVAMIWMATDYLRRYNPDWLAALFATGFFLISTTYTYVFWLHPELLNMFATMACLYFGLHVFDPGAPASWRGAPAGRLSLAPLFGARGCLMWSAGALSLGVYNKPMMLAVGLPVCFRLLRRRRFTALAGWLAGVALSLAVLAGVSVAFTGHPSAYLGVDRQGYNIHTPHRLPMEPKPLPADADAKLGRETAGWWWIFRIPDTTSGELREDAGYFLVGRHTGLFLYQPFSLIALALFLIHGRRAVDRWVILASLLVIAYFFLAFIPHNWHGGGGFVGNRYFIIAYPALLFLVTRIRPDWAVVPGFAAGALLVGPLLLAPLGLKVPAPTLQAHVRSQPFRLFPLEHSLREIPGTTGQVVSDVYFFGRKDQLRFVGDEMWLGGGDRAEVWLQTTEPLEELVFDVRSRVPGNQVRLEIEGASERLVAGPEWRRVTLSPRRPTLRRRERARGDRERFVDLLLYRMEVESATGEMPHWRETGQPYFFLGAALRVVREGAEKTDPPAPPAVDSGPS